VGALLAAVLFAVATALAAGRTSARTNRAQAQREASRLLDLIRLPSDASRSATEPGGDHGGLATPTDDQLTPNLVDAHAWWTVPGKAGDVLGYVAAHLPHGAKRSITVGGNLAAGYAAEDWSLPALPGVLSQREIGVIVVQLNPAMVGVRTDGEAIWIVPRPAWEVIPARVRAVLITATGVPHDGWPALHPGSYRLAGARAQRLVSFINRLGLAQPGIRNCPAEFPLLVKLRFLSATSRTLATAVEQPTGCSSVSLTIQGRRGPLLDDYPTVTSELRRLLQH
jgi:hypothetical protein